MLCDINFYLIELAFLHKSVLGQRRYLLIPWKCLHAVCAEEVSVWYLNVASSCFSLWACIKGAVQELHSSNCLLTAPCYSYLLVYFQLLSALKSLLYLSVKLIKKMCLFLFVWYKNTMLTVKRYRSWNTGDSISNSSVVVLFLMAGF